MQISSNNHEGDSIENAIVINAKDTVAGLTFPSNGRIKVEIYPRAFIGTDAMNSLGFLAGVYGMNFDTGISPFNLPELGMKFGYFMFWGLAVLIAGGLLYFFKRKKWL